MNNTKLPGGVEMTDLDLVCEVLEGNTDSFNILVGKYEHIIYKFIYNTIRDTEISRDITQEVFITAYNKLYTYNREYKFINWIFQIAKNKSIDYMRKTKKVHEINIEDAENTIYSGVSPELAVEYRETMSQVNEFIRTLGSVDRQILTLKYLQDKASFGDISEILNMSESAVKRRYYRLRDKFRDFIQNIEKRCRA
jgi:RNA polymerase sigma-70 factor (ECF subfamily)